MVDEYEVMNAHYFRKCHSETCGCDSDFLVINKEKNSIAGKVNSREEGRKLIKIMGFFGKEEITMTDLINHVYYSIGEKKSLNEQVP